MVDEIRGRTAPNSEYPRDDKVERGRPGGAVRKPFDNRLDPAHFVGEWRGEDTEDADLAVDRDRVAFEELAFADRKIVNSDDPEAERLAGEGADPESGRKNPGAGLAVVPNPFQLLGQLSTGMAGGTVRTAGAPDFSRYELAALVTKAADALSVRVDAGRSESEVRIEFNEDLLPSTSAVIRCEEHGGKLTVAFATDDSRVNVFLANSNASLRGELAERFGCEVTVTVGYRQQPRRDGEGDELVTEFLRKHSRLDDRDIFAFLIAYEELTTNVARHAVRPENCPIRLFARLEVANQHVSLLVCDDGPAFNPLNGSPKTPAIDGGQGLNLIRGYFPDARYRREDNCNIIRVKKYCPEATAE